MGRGAVIGKAQGRRTALIGISGALRCAVSQQCVPACAQGPFFFGPATIPLLPPCCIVSYGQSARVGVAVVGPYLNIHPYRRRVLHHAENMKSLKEQSSYGRGLPTYETRVSTAQRFTPGLHRYL